ncbi:MAG: phosphate signaling complex protein PhoU [Luteolibacter sp.]
MSSSHIFRNFDKHIDALRKDVLTMAHLCRQNLERAMQSLLHRDLELARAVIADDTDVDDLEVKIDQSGMDLLIRFTPVATDLRFVITSMKMSHNLERISDHAVNIAKRSKKICKGPEIDAGLIAPLHTLADKILLESFTAYTEQNADLGQSLKAKDKELDRLHKEVIASLSKRFEDPAEHSENLLHLIFVARSLERIGDLAVNIGEDSVFLSSAKDIRHEPIQWE